MQVIAQAPAAANITALNAGVATAAFTVIAGEPGAGTQCNLNLPGSNRLNGQPFVVRAAGFVTMPAGTYTSAATPLQFVLFGSNTASFSVSVGSALFSSTALAIFSVSSATAKTFPWEIQAEFIGDSTSAVVAGQGRAVSGNPNGVILATAPVATGASPASVSFASEPPLQFSLGITTAATNLLSIAGAVTVGLTAFQLEA